MSISPASLEYLALPAALLLVLAGRHSYRALTLVGVVVLALSAGFWLAQPVVVTHPNPPVGPSGYDTWPLPVIVAVVVGSVAFWRRFRKPGIGAALAMGAVALVVSSQGTWVA